MATINSRLKLKEVPRLVGNDSKNKAKEIYKVLRNTKLPIWLTGASGSGKSITAMNLAKKYAKEFDVPAYFVQLSPDMSKTSLILGLRLINGSLMPVNGVVAQCMEEGGVLIVDEATHGSQELLLMFNSILDRTSVTSIGDKIVKAKDTFRIIFCANDSTYSGNVKLPQSFAQRLVAFNFKYPSFKDEVEITKAIAINEGGIEFKVDDIVCKYIVSFMREIRTDSFPLSVRNSSMALILLNLADKTQIKPEDNSNLPGADGEPRARAIYERINNKKANDTVDLLDSSIEEFKLFVKSVGYNKFKDIVCSCFMSHLDVDIGIYDVDEIRKQIEIKVI